MEVALAMTIAAILMALALPSMRDLLDQSAIRSHRQMLVQDIRKVRFKAISRRRPAYLCALDRTRKCTMQALWNEGWLGFVDNNLNGIYDQGDEHVLQRQEVDRGANIAIVLHARWKNVKFTARGVLRRSRHFRVCSDPGSPRKKPMKVIRMNTWGRLAVEQDTLACL